MEALISIITPVYNAEKYIEKTILSVILQTYENWELIIVDDCSNDSSFQKIKKYSEDKRIKYYKNSKNMGPAFSRNFGIEKSKGQYVCFLDSDDFWSERKLENQINFMVFKDIEMSHGNYFFCDVNNKILKKIQVDEEIDYKKLLQGNQFKTMTMMIKKDKIGAIKFPMVKHEDYAFFLEILKNIKKSYANTQDYDSFCRIGQKSISSNKLRSALWTWNIYYKYEKLGFLASCYYFLLYMINGIKKYK